LLPPSAQYTFVESTAISRGFDLDETSVATGPPPRGTVITPGPFVQYTLVLSTAIAQGVFVMGADANVMFVPPARGACTMVPPTFDQ
jgi:hypothetical protein